MNEEAIKRATMPQGTQHVVDHRTIDTDYATLLPYLKPGIRVLDVGCGTGAITRGMAERVGPEGHATGIDTSEHLIAQGAEYARQLPNLSLEVADLFSYTPDEPFDLIASARVLQWLSNPKEALVAFQGMLKPGGTISILDYNHEQLSWKPEPPESMKQFYAAFLKWRTDAGMDNAIADQLPQYFQELNFSGIDVLEASEVYTRDREDFTDKVRIWTKVAESRGKQLVESGYLTEEERLRVIEEYDAWVANEAEEMTMVLKNVVGRY